MHANRLAMVDSLPTAVQNVDSSVSSRLSTGSGIIVGALDDTSGCAHIDWVGVIGEIALDGAETHVVWRNADFTLKPTPAGQVYWRKSDWFNFAPEVAERYMLDAIFTDVFDDFDWAKSRRTAPLAAPVQRHHEFILESGPHNKALGDLTPASKSISPTPGYVYLIWSQYGYKIGKAVNVKSRTKLFEVKLPFPIRVEHYAFFDDYTQAERTLHNHFHDKRLEGEWFTLTESDVALIKSLGVPQPTSRL